MQHELTNHSKKIPTWRTKSIRVNAFRRNSDQRTNNEQWIQFIANRSPRSKHQLKPKMGKGISEKPKGWWRKPEGIWSSGPKCCHRGRWWRRKRDGCHRFRTSSDHLHMLATTSSSSWWNSMDLLRTGELKKKRSRKVFGCKGAKLSWVTDTEI